MHETNPEMVLAIGLIFFLGLGADLLARRTPIPRVTFLILLGLAVGPMGVNLLPEVMVREWFAVITSIALGMIGFLLGQQFTRDGMHEVGKTVLAIASGKVLVSFVLIALALGMISLPLPAALMLAAIATATAPAAIYEVVHEMRLFDRFTKTLLSVVALDDMLGLLLFSFVLAILGANGADAWWETLGHGTWEVVASVVLGLVLGYPVAKVTGRLKPGELLLIEALGSVFLITGLSQWLGLSGILSAMALGSSVATFATHHTRAFHAIEHVQWPFMVIFFILAGASLELDALVSVGMVGVVYVLARIVGIWVGAYLGGRLSGADPLTSFWIGPALIPQAGVAIGMALMASQRLESYAHIILPVILASTVFFEIVGPVVTRFVITKVSRPA